MTAVTEIRHAASGAQTDAHFLTAEFDRRVRVWSVAERALLAEHITPCTGGRLVVACFDDRPMHVLDSRSGETVAMVRAIRGFYGSAQADFGIGELYGEVALVDIDVWTLRWKAPTEGFARANGSACDCSSARTCRSLKYS